jgi:hypothetical protein
METQIGMLSNLQLPEAALQASCSTGGTIPTQEKESLFCVSM